MSVRKLELKLIPVSKKLTAKGGCLCRKLLGILCRGEMAVVSCSVLCAPCLYR